MFKLNPDGSAFSVVLNFDGGLGGREPVGKLIQGADGNLYGTTFQGGTGAGTVFRIVFPSPATSSAALVITRLNGFAAG